MDHRTAVRTVMAGRLRLGPGVEDPKNTEILQKIELRARSQGDFQSAVISAGYYAKKSKKTMYGFLGNSYMHAVWLVTYKPSDYLNPINNMGDRVFSVTPDLVFSFHNVIRD